MKSSLSRAFVLAIVAIAFLQLGMAEASNQHNNDGISMTIYPVVRGADGNQYLITPSGKHVTVPGLGIAQNATQVFVYRDQANHFWYTARNGQQVAVTPQQLEAAQVQINAQSGGGGMSPQSMPSPQSFYNSTPSYSGGFNGIPYGTQINMEGAGQYSYMGSGGNRQSLTPTPQISNQLNQWQQQVPYGQHPSQGSQSQQMQGSSSKADDQSRMGRRRERRSERLDDRSRNQASNSAHDQAYADSKMQSGQTLGTGVRSRQAAREMRRSNRSDRRADRLQNN